MSEKFDFPSHFVGIGASAGGLEALQLLLQHLPADTGASFIIVQHLSPDFKSLMAELLARHTRMSVYNAEDGVQTLPNTVYIIPPKKTMLISEGTIRLSDRTPDNGLHLPIDLFFHSLAEDQQHKAIGVILSGTGSDGSRGVKALKEAGGMVIAQDPASARFDGMPISAVNTGIVDIILKPERIGPQIEEYIQHPLVRGERSPLHSELTQQNKTLPEIFNILKLKCGIEFNNYKPSTVARRIERRMTINQVSSLSDYLTLLLQNPFEVEVLAKELLIGVTRFFRDQEAFDALKEYVVPDIINNQSDEDQPIRIWVAGCSTGEEAYSMGMLFSEALKELKISKEVKIFATDVDADAISTASQGVYSLDIVNDIPSVLLKKYFVNKGQKYQVTNELRQLVIFATHNLINDPPFSNMHMVSCRNMLIYLQQSMQRKTLTGFHFALRKNGYLFLGSSENLGDLDAHFDTMGDPRTRIFKKISNLRIPIASSPIHQTPHQNSTSPSLPPVNNLLRNYRGNVPTRGEINPNDTLIRKYAPPSILLDENFDAVHVYGDLSKYIQRLPPGRVSVNINDLIAEEAGIAVSTALHRARQTGEDIYYAGVSFQYENTEELVDLTVLRVRQPESGSLPRYYWLVIEPREQRELSENQNKVVFDQKEQARQRISDLEIELKRNREHLQVTVEELETTNEELQSANEELMSANEELQSTNEELQSVNEELFTVNSEYQEKIAEITVANADLDTVLKISNIGIIFLDNNLLIRRFTKAATQYINLVESDLERPIHHISSPSNYSTFMHDVSHVSQSGESLERQINMESDKTVMVSIHPHQVHPNQKHYSVTITFTDITRIASAGNPEKLRSLVHNTMDKLMNIQRTPPALKLSVLIVDDDQEFIYIVTELLSRSNESQYDIHSAINIEEAIELFKQHTFDVCLTDFRIGPRNAVDLFEVGQEYDQELPYIVLTGYPDETLFAKLIARGIYDLISKDVLSSELLSRSIRYATQKRQLTHALKAIDKEIVVEK